MYQDISSASTLKQVRCSSAIGKFSWVRNVGTKLSSRYVECVARYVQLSDQDIVDTHLLSKHIEKSKVCKYKCYRGEDWSKRCFRCEQVEGHFSISCPYYPSAYQKTDPTNIRCGECHLGRGSGDFSFHRGDFGSFCVAKHCTKFALVLFRKMNLRAVI